MADTEMMDDPNADAEAQGWGQDGEGDGQAEGWGEDGGEDGEDGAGWYDYDDEENDIVKEAIEATRKLKERKEKITPVRITFRPPNYKEGQIARIVGDFTDWVPVTMRMHTIKEIDEDPTKNDVFFVVVKLAKGFRYRFSFEVDGTEVVDCSGDNLQRCYTPSDPNSSTSKGRADAEGKLTNYIEVPQDGMTM